MQEKISPREARSSHDMYAKPVVMSQPEETKVKQRQRLLSDELTKPPPQPNSRPPTPPGKLQIGKISSLLRNSLPGGSTAPYRDTSSGHAAENCTADSQSTQLPNGHAPSASWESHKRLNKSSSANELSATPAPAMHSNSTENPVTLAIAQFEERIGRRSKGANVAKQSSMASPGEEGDRPLSHRSSQRAEALRQLRELWLSDEAEQPGTPELPRGSNPPSLLHAAAAACNGYARDSSRSLSEPPTQAHAAGNTASTWHSHADKSPSQQTSQDSQGRSDKQAAAVQSGNQDEDSQGKSNESELSRKHLDGASSQHEDMSDGDGDGSEQPGHERQNHMDMSSAEEQGYADDSSRAEMPRLQQDSHVQAPKHIQHELQGEAGDSSVGMSAQPQQNDQCWSLWYRERDTESVVKTLPVSVSAACVSSNLAALATGNTMPNLAQQTVRQLHEREEASAQADNADEPLPVSSGAARVSSDVAALANAPSVQLPAKHWARPLPEQEDSSTSSTSKAGWSPMSAADELLPVSSGAPRVSGDIAASADADRVTVSAEHRASKLPKQTEASSCSTSEAEAIALGRRDEPAWVSGFREDIGLALGTLFTQSSAHTSNPHEYSSPSVSPAPVSSSVHCKLLSQKVSTGKQEQDCSATSTVVSTPGRPAGLVQRNAVPNPVPLHSSQSRSALMQGWRSIMQGSPQQSCSKSASAASGQKSGLDLAWRINEVVHELSSCLARTAEQQQLLTDAARLLTRGEEEDTDYAAEKLQAADELRQWSERAQCSSIACLVGILKELQHAKQTRQEEVHFNSSAWPAVLGSRRQIARSKANRR